MKSDPMWTKVKSSVKREISEKYLIFFYLVHTAALKGFVVKAFSISERRSDFMRIWEKIASRHFCAVKIFSRIFFKIYSNIFNSLSSKVCFVMKIIERKFVQIFSTVCLRTFFAVKMAFAGGFWQMGAANHNVQCWLPTCRRFNLQHKSGVLSRKYYDLLFLCRLNRNFFLFTLTFLGTI